MTIDAFGTLLELRDPVPALRTALGAHGIERAEATVRRAFGAEVAYYVPRAHTGRDAASLAALRQASARVFLDAVGAADVDADTFPFVESLTFAFLPDAREACDDLLRAGLRLAIVSNWDIGLQEVLHALGLDLPVVTSAQAGAPKPDPRIFEVALRRIDASSSRAVHVGDSADDEEGARRARMRFEPAPLAAAARRILA